MELDSLGYEEVVNMTLNTEPSIMDTFLQDWVSDTTDKLKVESLTSSADFLGQALGELDCAERDLEGLADLDATVLVDPTQQACRGTLSTSSRGSRKEEPVLSLVAMNPRTGSSFDLVRGAMVLLPELPATAVAVRTVQVTCGRDSTNALVVSDTRVSHQHFLVKITAARGGLVTMDLQDKSSNGTWVNGKRVANGEHVKLAVGDHILVLPASHVGKADEVGYLLLHDAHGAECAGAQDIPRSLPPSPRGTCVPRGLEEDLCCGICTDVLFHCLTLVPCGHNFCSACFVKWRRRSSACPECRECVQQAVRSPNIDKVVETFLLAHPEAARTEDEVKAMEAAEQDPNNVAMMRWLTRPPIWAGGQSDAARNTATPMRRGQGGASSQVRRQDTVASSVCAIS